ncbi:uncharacterized protein [Leuresthes tenuis]|uniref:uncharacterized protein n=1 Tax=Leuresthes tenuis TaxID=355514 RepID=UPI003B5057FF
MSTQKLLVETLDQLSPDQFDEFKSLVGTKKGSFLIPRRSLKAANTQDVVQLLAQTYGPQCVEVSREALMKMSRTDLVQRLSGVHSGAREKQPEDKQLPPLTQRVETMESILEKLLETLADLSSGELKAFKDSSQIYRYYHLYSRTDCMVEATADLHFTVYSMVQTYGPKSVEKTEKTLMEMKKKDLMQRLSKPKKEKLDECQSALIHKMAAMLAVKELLLETLEELKGDEFETFKSFLHLTQFKKDLPQIPWSLLGYRNKTDTVDLMVNILGQHYVEVTRETFLGMNRTDLAQRLPESSFGPKEEHTVDECLPALTHKIKTMESVTELLLEKLSELSGRWFSDFWITFQQTQQTQPYYRLPWMLLYVSNTQYLVFFMVRTYGQQAVEKTEQILQKMEKTEQILQKMMKSDRQQKLPESSFGTEKKLSVHEQRSGLSHKVSNITSV